MDIQKALALLRTKGVRAASEQSLRDIALENGFDRPFELIELLRSAVSERRIPRSRAAE